MVQNLMPRYLSEHFSLDELTQSNTAARRGIDNTPSPGIISALTRTAALLETARKILRGAPIVVSSGYRCKALNDAVGGAKASAHISGLAADIICPAYGSPFEVAQALAASKLAYDQIIHEFGQWVHIGLAPMGEQPRRQALSIFEPGAYQPGILERRDHLK